MMTTSNRINGAAAFVGAMETMRGWRVSDGDVLLVGLQPGRNGAKTRDVSGMGSLSDMHGTSDRSDREQLLAAVEGVTRQMPPETDAVAVVTAVDEDPMDAFALNDNLTRALAVAERSLPIERELVVAVGEGNRQVWEVDRDRSGETIEGLTNRGYAPEAFPLMGDTGMYSSPAQNREQHLSEVDPLPQPGFEPLDTAEPERADMLDGLKPSARVAFALRCLDRISDSKIPKPANMQAVAHVANDGYDTRDGIMGGCLGDPDRADALVAVSRAAPPEQRAALQAVGGSVRVAHNEGTPQTRRLLDLAEADEEQAGLVRLSRVALDTMTPDERAGMVDYLRKHMATETERIDAEWETDPAREHARAAAMPSPTVVPPPAGPHSASGPEVG